MKVVPVSGNVVTLFYLNIAPSQSYRSIKWYVVAAIASTQYNRMKYLCWTSMHVDNAFIEIYVDGKFKKSGEKETLQFGVKSGNCGICVMLCSSGRSSFKRFTLFNTLLNMHKGGRSLFSVIAKFINATYYTFSMTVNNGSRNMLYNNFTFYGDFSL